VVATLVMTWRDPALAFDPETAQDRFKVYTGDAFSTEMSRRGQLWPQFSVVNQQGNRWVQNRVVVVSADRQASYLERFSTTLQAPDFDFRDFPFDQQRFFIRVELLTPEWMFLLREIKGYSEVGRTLGEEEWVVTGFNTSFTEGEILGRPVSRFNFQFQAKRHREYYFFRILLPLAIILVARVCPEALATRRRDQPGEPVEQLQQGERQRGAAVGLGFRQPIDDALGVDVVDSVCGRLGHTPGGAGREQTAALVGESDERGSASHRRGMGGYLRGGAAPVERREAMLPA
jgi:hypothetical protein